MTENYGPMSAKYSYHEGSSHDWSSVIEISLSSCINGGDNSQHEDCKVNVRMVMQVTCELVIDIKDRYTDVN